MHCLLSSDPAVVAITETWFNDTVNDNLVVDNRNYSVYRTDRATKRGGGVCLLINNNVFHSVCVPIPSKYCNIEIVSADAFIGEFKCRLMVVYRPPSSEYDQTAIQHCIHMSNCINNLSSKNTSLILCGDFNLPSLSCNSVVNLYSCTSIVSDLISSLGLMQLVLEPTRYNYATGTSSILDLVLTNDPNLITNLSVDQPFSTSDHCLVKYDIIFNTIIHSSSTPSPGGSYDFKRANWSLIFQYLHNIDFMREFSFCDTVPDVFNRFYCILFDCICRYVPFVKSTRKRYRNKSYPKHIMKCLSRKRAAWRKYKKNRSPNTLTYYKRMSTDYRTKVRDISTQRELNVLNSQNLNSFYRYCNRTFNNNSVIGPLRSHSGAITTEPEMKANLFLKNFSNYFTKDNNTINPLQPRTESTISDIQFTPTLIKRSISLLRSQSKGGPDDIPPEFIKRCSLWLTLPLSYLFRLSFREGYIPTVWSTARVTPIFKKGDAADPQNYRPISLTCVFCKMMESIIKDQLTVYLLSNGLITPDQHAFIRNHSTTTNLMACVRDWSIALSSKKCSDIIYIDIKRAFDSIVHSKLLHKLQCYGISDKLLKWIEAFLQNRNQCVVIENVSSDYSPVISGIIQGSVLGPTLFILYINDLIDCIPCNVHSPLFADDLKLYSSFEVESISMFIADLQLAIDLIFEWASKWQLQINIDKCYCMRLLSKYLRFSPVPIYTLNGVVISVTNETRDLGIQIDNRLTYSSHISQIIRKANQRVGMLFRGFHSRDVNILRRAFVTYIRPLLEYNSIIWNPTIKKYINPLESVQRRFTKRIPSLHSFPYLERLKLINLQSLEERRLKFDLIMYYKILNNLTPFALTDFFNIRCPMSTLRDCSPQLCKPTKGSNYIFSSFCVRGIDCWNNLPDSLKHQKSLPSFKSGLLKENLLSYLYGDCYTNLAAFHCFS